MPPNRSLTGALLLDGRRLPVLTVVDESAAHSPEWVADAYDLPVEEVRATLAWAAEHPDEIEAERALREAGRRRVAETPGAVRIGGVVYLPAGTVLPEGDVD